MGAAENDTLRARVLVVDDEPSIRLLCRVNLELEGHEVVEAGSLGKARELLAGAVDLVLLDVHLGRESSAELVGECHSRQPPVPVVIVTGSADVLLDRAGDADAVLPKPFEIETLLSTVRELTSARTKG